MGSVLGLGDVIGKFVAITQRACEGIALSVKAADTCVAHIHDESGTGRVGS